MSRRRLLLAVGLAALLVPTAGLAAVDDLVTFVVGETNAIAEVEATLIVPATPSPVGTVFLWPGLQSHGANFLPIDNGVLQSVLTWGPSCAPGDKPTDYSSWWVSAQYVNSFGHLPGFTGCTGGPVMQVQPGDHLLIHYWLDGSIWRQRVDDLQSQASVSFDFDLRHQAQNVAEFEIETYDGGHLPAAEFEDVTITFAHAEKGGCAPQVGADQAISGIRISQGGRTCHIDRIVLDPGSASSTSQCEGGRSVSGDTSVNVTFVNTRAAPVDLDWLDYDGSPKSFGTIAAGASQSMQSFLTHAWRVTDAQGRCLAGFVIDRDGEQFVIR